MIKLKNILSEAYAWERQTGKALPTLAEVQAAYQAKMREDANLDPEDDDHEYTDDADLPEPYDPDEDDMFESAKPDFLDLDNDNNKTEPMKKAAADSKSVKESLNSRILNNLRGSEYILSETFKK
jgi:hypothetical protein